MNSKENSICLISYGISKGICLILGVMFLIQGNENNNLFEMMFGILTLLVYGMFTEFIHYLSEEYKINKRK